MSSTVTVARLVRDAVRPLGEAGWQVRGNGAIRRHANGYWAQIVLTGVGKQRPPLDAALTAGVCSPYLLGVVNRQDPERPPNANFVAAHAQVVWDLRIAIEHVDDPVAPPFTIPAKRTLHPVVLGPDTAPTWMCAAFAELAPRCDALCSDEALLDHLLGDPGMPVLWLRDAALLARRLGDADRLAQALDRAAAAHQANVEREIERYGSASEPADDQDRYPQDWSHARFLRFLEAAPR
jgi:hypothetical protein